MSNLSYVSLRILLDGFALSRSIVAVAAVGVSGEDASQAEEGGGEFHGWWRASWIGERELLRWHRVPTPSHPVNATSIHPSTLAILGTRRFLVISCASGGSSQFFLLSRPEQWKFSRIEFRFPLCSSVYRPIDSQFRK